MSTDRTVADLVVERLVAWDVERIYGYAGDGNNPLLGALRRSDIAPAFGRARHEESAAFMAVADAKYSGGVGVVTSTQGPGAMHLINGLYDAKLDSVPVVALVAQQHTSVLGSGYQQEINLGNVFADVAGPYLQTVASAEQVPLVVDRAFRSALTHRTPVVVILPHDVQNAPAPELGEDLGQEHGVVVTAPEWTHGVTVPRDDDVARAVEVLDAGERIAFLVGRGAAGAQAEVMELADRLGAGVTMSLLGKPYVGESSPLVGGTMGHLGTTASARILQNCDTLLIIGSNDPWTEFYPKPGQARAVQIDLDPVHLANRYPIEVGLVGDAALALRELLGRVAEKDRSAWREDVEKWVRQWREISRERSEVPARGLNPELVARRLADHIPHDARLAVDVGSSVYHYVRQMDLPTSVPAHLSSTLASMGCGIPYAIAAKAAAPAKPVAVLAGDGAVQMLGINELITVAEAWPAWEDPTMVIVVLSNRDLAEVSWEQRESESQPRFARSQEVPEFDMAAYAELLGLRGIRVEEPDQLAPALEEAFSADRPTVIDAITDPDVPLLPPFPHGREMLESMRTGLQAEGAAGEHALDLLETYARMEEERFT
ncbi:thiamine pyrophosphate-requiring protein [Dietzia cinnamea]|uniref:thiamine pyrophosphate-requiring protein n=1 Tax=Dietzia cinnamea TaxID=321318 RepID=UPI0021AF29E2|nr:thiamine pyrophosphate-requiring protein [Dietzia cinnamea]MCT1713425.1 thiamine pyrophosphate-requiring protein [Dietzia cinnamea]MCT2264831.1 thiamine pyrophosphate-requiring protein [Dietzia cinnamea]MCT2273484.1 thiamine pyrophosphate-requiring protein [Dietzia cinnamea]